MQSYDAENCCNRVPEVLPLLIKLHNLLFYSVIHVLAAFGVRQSL